MERTPLYAADSLIPKRLCIPQWSVSGHIAPLIARKEPVGKRNRTMIRTDALYQAHHPLHK